MANREHTKGTGEWPTGVAGLGLWPSSVALLHKFRLGLFCSSVGVLVIFPKISGRLAWFKPPGLLFPWNSSKIFWHLVFTLLILFCCAVVKHESRGVVGTHMCTNHINTKRNELEILFYFKVKMGCC